MLSGLPDLDLDGDLDLLSEDDLLLSDDLDLDLSGKDTIFIYSVLIFYCITCWNQSQSRHL